MSYSVYAYLTDAKKVTTVYGSKDKILLGQLYQSLKDKFIDLDKSFPEQVNDQRNSLAILQDIVNGKIRFPEIPFMYGYVYEYICEYYGRPIFSNKYLWELDKQSAFIPIPLSSDFPYIISINADSLYLKKKQYLSLEEGQGLGDVDYEGEKDDLAFIFDEAMERKMDLVICVY